MLSIGVDAIASRIDGLATRFRRGLAETNDVVVHDQGGPRCGIVTFTVRGLATQQMNAQLRAQGLQLSAPGRRNAQFDLGARGLDAVFRAGVHYFNTAAEVDQAVELIAAL